MGRAERRRAERRNRIENRKAKILMSREEIGEMKQKVSSNVSAYNVESLMTCFALAEHRLYGFEIGRADCSEAVILKLTISKSSPRSENPFSVLIH